MRSCSHPPTSKTIIRADQGLDHRRARDIKAGDLLLPSTIDTISSSEIRDLGIGGLHYRVAHPVLHRLVLAVQASQEVVG